MGGKTTSSQAPLSESALAEGQPMRLGHDLRNSITILLGIIERLGDLEQLDPNIPEIVSDLDRSTEQIHQVARTLGAMKANPLDIPSPDC